MQNMFTTKPCVLKDTISNDKKTILIENIRYPNFECETTNKKAKNLCSKMNKFYNTLAKQYSQYVHTNLTKKALKKADKLTKPYGAVMNYCISFDDGENISVIIDISVFDGKDFSSGRACHNWCLSRCALMPSGYYIDKHKKSRSHVKNLALQILENNMQSPSFGYFSDCKKQFLKHFDINNFYFVPGGIAFFIDAGLLSDLKNGPSVFVIPFEKADGVLKIAPALSNNTENDKI